MFCAHILIAQQSSLILTGVSRPNNNFPVENSSNTARSIELFVVEDIDDLSFYGYATSNSIYAGDQSNGSFQFPSGSFEAGDFIYLTRDNNDFENLHGFSADYELTQLNFMGGNTSGPYCVVEILYSPDWSDTSPQTIDFWASNSPEYIINGGWSKRNNCDGPNPGPNSWVLESPVFTFENGVLTEDYSNFNISEWTYVSSDPNSINFGTYEFCGCTNELADNYVSIATIDDNNCIYYGCLDPLASNWDFDANTDNGSCLYEGCIDSVACNFNSQANLNDFSCLYPEPYYDCNGNCNNDANNDGICDELEIMGLLLNCDGVSVSANITDDNCDGVWNVYFDFEYENEIVGLEDVEAVFSSSSGDIFTPISLSVSDELYDLSYLIDVPDIYTVTFQTSADCNFGQLIVPINELIDVSLSYETETLDCDGSSAVIIGSLINSPPGIYDIYIDGEQVTEVSTGLDDIVFDAWQDGNSVDCEGNLLSTPENHSIALNPANGDFSEMEVGDIIGAFFVDASCGLVNAGSIVYDGGVTGGPVYGDDTSSPYSEGFSSGQEITWLLEKASDGLIYNIDITWDDTAFDSGDYWLPNGLSSMTSILITETYENTFDIELQEGSYDLAIYNGNCLLLEEASVLIEGGPSIDDISYITINNPCVDSSDGVITIDGLNNNLDYDFSIINLDVGNSFFGSAVEQSTYSFTDLPSGEYFLSYSESLCGFTNQEFLSVNFESDVPSVDLGDNVSTCETSVCLEANYDQNVGSDNSLSFNGVDNYIDAGNLNFLESDYVSYGVWIKSTGDTGSTQYIVGKSATNPGTTLGIQPDGNIYFAIGTNGTSTQGYATAINTNCNQTYFDNKWHFVVGTYDGVDIKIYVDGQLKGETELNGGPVYYGNLPFYIGYRPDNTSYFNGLISDIFIFDYALSQNEIENYFCSGVIGTESGLKAYWPMNEASGNTIYDAGPNSVNIGINSAAWSTESKPECALLSYLWSTGETSLSIDATSSESYSVEVINELGCLGIDEITVVINECGCTDVLACNYNADANEDDNSCLYIALVDLGQDIIDICEDEIILDAGEGYDTYLWSTGDNTQTIAIDESGTYSVDVSISTANNYSMYFDDGFGDGSTCGGESMEGQTYTALNEFVPSADYVIVDSFIIDPTDNITISAWAKGINSEGGIFFCSLDDSGNQSWINTLNGQGVYVGLAGGSQSLDTEFPTFNNNEWRYYSVTIEDLGNSITNISFYLDGELLNSSIETNLDIEWSGLLFGRFQYQNGAFVGAIDDVQLWDAVLSQEEIQQYMNCSPTGSEPDLIGYWNFEEGPSAGQVLDVTGNGNNGTIVCATYTNDVPSQSCEVVSCVELDEITVAFGVEGCSDQLACNYNENAVCEDDSCEYADINTDCDGNCLFGYVLIDEICVLALSGCTDENACNYDPNANTDSGLCEYADINADCNGICLDGYVLNDGFCVLIIEGCSDDNACNFNPNVTIDNGSCQYSSLIDLGSDISSCNSYTISAESGYDQYVWSNGQTTQEITVTESNTYTVTAFQTCDFGDIEGFTFLNSFSGSNYYISNETSTWDDANDICAAIYQGHLVTITSQEEDNFVYNNVSSVIPNNYWIGLSDVAIEGDFEWVTGEALIYNNWNDALGEPNNNFPGENYVEVFSDNSAYPGYWNDAPLINSSTGNPVARYYVLEIDCQCSSDGSINIAIGLDGCTDPSACNYNPDAICDDALCYNNDLGCGCDQPAAEENADCNGDCLDGYINISGFCVEEILGCTDENACNYDVLANTNDLSCYNNDLGCGCDQPVAEENADCDGDCFEGYADFGLGCELIIEGCTDETACNYNILANIDSECLYGNECGCPPLEFTNVTSNPINGTELTVEWIGGCEDLNTIYLTFNNITDNIVVANANWENDDALLPNTGIHTWNIPCYLLEEGDEYGYFIAQLYNGTSYESNTSGGNTDWESVVENGGTTILTNDPIYWGDDIEGSPGGNPCVSNTSNFPNVPTEYVCPQTDFFEYLYGSLGYNISISADLLCVGGCLDSDACNYSPDAAYDDGSCVYPVDSCTDCNGNDLGGQDCSGVCEGDFLQDDCGICDNDLNNDNEDFVINIIAIDSPCDSPDGSIIVDLNPIYPFDELSFQWYLDGSVVLGETSQNIFNIGSGNYVLEVSNNFCTLSTEEIIVQEAEPVEFTDFIISDFDGFQIDCSGNASIEIEFSGGSAPYDISVLLDGNITPTFITDVTSPVLVESLFGAGSYEFVIFSADGICQYTSTPIEFAEQEGALLVDFDNIDDCYNNSGLAQGSINVSVAGGVPPYIISYSPCTSNCFGAAIADDQIVSFDGVASGTYLVEVLDFNGCTISSEQFIETSSEIYLSVLPDSEPYNCCLEDFDNNGVCDLADESAIFNIQITGGTPPYTYSGFDNNLIPITGESVQVDDGNGQFIEIITLSNLATGDYLLSIVDDGGCAASASTLNNSGFNSLEEDDEIFVFTVNQIEPMEIEITDILEVECFGDPVSVSFSVTQTGVLTSNNFSVEVLENSTSIFTDDLEVGSLELDFCYPAMNNATSQTILINNVGILGLPALDHNLQEGDVFGLFNEVNPVLDASGYQCVGGIENGSICNDFGNGVNGFSPLEWSNGNFNNDGNLTLITWFADPGDNLGVLASNNSNWISDEIFGFVERDGLIYSCTIEFFVGGPQGFVDTYIPNTQLYISSIIVSDQPFLGGDGTVTVTFEPDSQDVYEFIFTDDYGCTQIIDMPSSDLDIPVPDAELASSINIINNPSCPEGSDGSLNVSLSGGYGAYNVSLFNGNDIQVGQIVNLEAGVSLFDFNNLSASDYYVIVSDELGCSVFSNLVIVEDLSPITIENQLIQNPSCNALNINGGDLAGPNATGSSSDGSIELIISGGTPPYNVQIESGGDLFNLTLDENAVPFSYNYFISNLNIGSYSVSIQDFNGCDFQYTVNGLLEDYIIDINQPDPLVVDPFISEILCFEGEGDIILNWSGGTPFLIGGEYQFIQPTGVDPDGVNTNITIAN
ncbi:MAG: hypothetical protein CMD26_03855, partial [Flavobacteriales bacterium]|nr:hypothetical protein [Flavobacteriales bacterium]